MKILFYGYGNPGRQDDGLGVIFVDRLEAWVKEQGIAQVGFDANYQLNIEDADTAAEYDVVIFVDASTEDIADFKLSQIEPSDKSSFSMHSVSPAFIVHLCQDMYHQKPGAFLVHIKGYEWALQEGLTPQAEANLSKVLTFFKNKLLNIEQFSLSPDALN